MLILKWKSASVSPVANFKICRSSWNITRRIADLNISSPFYMPNANIPVADAKCIYKAHLTF